MITKKFHASFAWSPLREGGNLLCGDPPPPHCLCGVSVGSIRGIYSLNVTHVLMSNCPFLTMQISCVEHSLHTSDLLSCWLSFAWSYYSAGNADTGISLKKEIMCRFGHFNINVDRFDSKKEHQRVATLDKWLQVGG